MGSASLYGCRPETPGEGGSAAARPRGLFQPVDEALELLPRGGFLQPFDHGRRAIRPRDGPLAASAAALAAEDPLRGVDRHDAQPSDEALVVLRRLFQRLEPGLLDHVVGILIVPDESAGQTPQPAIAAFDSLAFLGRCHGIVQAQILRGGTRRAVARR